MTHKQKAIELLSQMPEPFRAWALENLEKYPVEIESEPKTISEAIKSFLWAKTLEGEIFWARVYKHYRYGYHLPEFLLKYKCEQLVKENEELKKKVAEFVSKLNTQTK